MAPRRTLVHRASTPAPSWGRENERSPALERVCKAGNRESMQYPVSLNTMHGLLSRANRPWLLPAACSMQPVLACLKRGRDPGAHLRDQAHTHCLSIQAHKPDPALLPLSSTWADRGISAI
jgi:hypothetical protein